MPPEHTPLWTLLTRLLVSVQPDTTCGVPQRTDLLSNAHAHVTLPQSPTSAVAMLLPMFHPVPDLLLNSSAQGCFTIVCQYGGNVSRPWPHGQQHIAA